jgi:hypothetical protein
MVIRRFRLVGFVGDIVGNEGALVKMLPVFRHRRNWWVAQRDRWTIDDGARALHRRERESVQRLPMLSRSKVAEGDLVWLSGPELAEACAATAALGEFGKEFTSWSQFRRGFAFRTGTPESFLGLANALYNRSKKALIGALFDRQVRWTESRALEDCFAVFSACRYYDDDADCLATCALYFDATRDVDRYQLARLAAVEDGAFPDDGAFDERVAQIKLTCSEGVSEQTARAPAGAAPSPQLRGL